jgi:hypothetical protein
MIMVTVIGGASFFLATYFISEGSRFKKLVMGMMVVAFLAGLPFVVMTALSLLQYMLDSYIDLDMFKVTFGIALACLLVVMSGFYLVRKE